MRQILLQNATAILLQNVTEVYYKMRQGFYHKIFYHKGFYYKMQQLLQNAAILLQNTTVITKCDIYYKMQQCYYKIRQLLQNVTFFTNCDSTDTEVSSDRHRGVIVLKKRRS